MAIKIPDAIMADEALIGRFKVRLSEALADRMGESDWRKFAVMHGVSAQIVDHPRLFRSLHWNDPDYEGHVLGLVEYLFDKKPLAAMDLFERPDIQAWISANDADLMKMFGNEPDALIDAITHSLEETEAVSGIIDLSQYTARIQAALPDDPYQAIGATKDMLEATMKTILRRRGLEVPEKVEFPALTTQCFTELRLTGTSAPTSKGERHMRKIASSAKAMIETANEFRNLAGTGHGRIVGEEEVVTATDASLVASSGLVLAAWLLRKASDSD